MLRIRGLAKQFVSKEQRVAAVAQVDLDLPAGQVLTLLGPSGCGKTTTLRCVAGLERPTASEITIGDRVVFSSTRRIAVPPNRRNIGMVFQSYAIWPHMRVADNVAFPLRMQGKHPKARQAELVLQVLRTVELDALAGREATQLSGGQQQRLALARALVWQPDLLLLDEPLSNLDAKLREQMRLELKRLQRDLGLTMVYVTHDQSEALALSDVIAVMNAGAVVQVGTPQEIYDRPASRFVAEFVGSTNLIPARPEITVDSAGYAGVSTAIGTFRAIAPDLDALGDRSLYVSLRPEDLTLSPTPPVPADGANVLEGRVRTFVFLGEATDYQIQVGDQSLRVRGHRGAKTHDFAEGDQVYLSIRPERCLIVREDRVEATGG